MICKFCGQKIEIAAWAGDDGGHRCASGERHEPDTDPLRKHWADKLRAGADSIDKLIQGGSWPKYAHEAVLARIFDTDANNLRYLADLVSPEIVKSSDLPANILAELKHVDDFAASIKPCVGCHGTGGYGGPAGLCEECGGTGMVSR